MRYQFLKENQKKHNIKKACKILKISRSGFYDYLHRRKSKRAIENEALAEIITDIFKENEGRYGCRRIQKVLLRRNIKINEKRVSRIMSKQGLIAKGAKKPYRYYPNKTQYEERENILNCVFSASKKNKIWVGDITYIPTRHGFLDTRIKDSLVMSAFYQAVGRELPNEGLIVHTDQGAQFTSQRFQALLLRYGCKQSMSRKGNPYDNAVMESFYRTLKRELVQDADYDNPEQARMDIYKYIETYYNTKRIHSALGWLSPIQFEIQNS